MNSKIIVSKFGGTSMQDAQAMLRSAEIAVQKASNVVVVSATSGTTNQLLNLGKSAEQGNWEICQEILDLISEKHLKIAQDLKMTEVIEIRQLLAEAQSLAKGIFLLKDFSPRVSDALVSLGERLSSVLFSHLLKQNLPQVCWCDAREVIITDSHFGQARPLIFKIREQVQSLWRPLLEKQNVLVTQGFIGRSEQGQTSTLGRGGSDYSAALIAEAIEADLLEIWTDVAGIATTDPRLVNGTRLISEISFKEASELATFGAKILHPATMAPAIRQEIPVFVGSSFEPEAPGTWIRKVTDSAPLVRAMALRKNQVLLTLSTPEMLNAHGFLAKIFSVFDHFKISVDAITTSEISVALTLDGESNLSPELLKDLGQFAELQIEKDLALISIIGNNINQTPGFALKVFGAIQDFNVRMICQGGSRHNFCFLIVQSDASVVLQRLHRHLIENSV